MLNLYKPACPEQTCQMHRKSPHNVALQNPLEFHLFHLYQQHFANIVFTRTNIIYDIERYFFFYIRVVLFTCSNYFGLSIAQNSP